MDRIQLLQIVSTGDYCHRIRKNKKFESQPSINYPNLQNYILNNKKLLYFYQTMEVTRKTYNSYVHHMNNNSRRIYFDTIMNKLTEYKKLKARFEFRYFILLNEKAN